jgi:hypothetical protein
LVRFVIEQYRDELVMSLQGNLDEQQVAEDREVVASDLLNILHRCGLPNLVITLILTVLLQHPYSIHRHKRTKLGP